MIVKYICMMAGSLMLVSSIASAQTTGVRGTAKGTSTALGVTSTAVDSNHTGLDVVLGTRLAGEDATNNVFRIEGQWEYETIAASQTDQVLGSTGAAGDLLHAVVCVMTAASVGVVSIKDGTGSAINLIAAQAAAIQIFTPPLDLVSADAGWKITTGTNTTCLGIGRFS